jgi:hypothetical protein
MSTYTQLLYQIVFGSKDYTTFLNHGNQGLLFGYIVGMLNKRNCHPYQVGGFGNHVHNRDSYLNDYQSGGSGTRG